MADFGANILMQDASNRMQGSRDFYNMLMGVVQNAQNQKQQGIENERNQKLLDYKLAQGPDLSMGERDLMMTQRYQQGDRSPEVTQYLQARAAMEGPKYQYTQDPMEPGKLIPQSFPNPFQAMMGGQSPAADLFNMPQSVPDQPLTPEQWQRTMLTGNVPEIPPVAAEDLKESSDLESMAYSLPAADPSYMQSTKGKIDIGEANTKLGQYAGEKQIDNFFAGMKLTEEQQGKQKAFEKDLNDYLDAVSVLVDKGSIKQELPDNATIADVLQNLSASVQASDIGKKAGGAIGTQTSTALSKMEQVHPRMFGALRDLLGMTGRELDTKVEQDYYKGTIPGGGAEISTVLKTLGELSNRFGTGEAAEKIEGIRQKVQQKKDISQMSREERYQRYLYLKQKEASGVKQ